LDWALQKGLRRGCNQDADPQPARRANLSWPNFKLRPLELFEQPGSSAFFYMTLFFHASIIAKQKHIWYQ
jgi:hypothetical protein